MPEDRHGPALELQGLGKCYRLYDRPQDRLKQSLADGLNALANRARARLGYPPRPARHYARPFWALRGVDLQVARGETLGIIGRNGSGKSTLLQLVAGTLKPSEGHLRTHGRVAALLELGSGFNPEFSGRENVYLNAAILGLQRHQIQDRFEAIESFAGIGEFIDQPVKNYSSGMVVRLAFAVSVCVDPDILIVDEALAVGDAAFQFKCLQRIRELTERGTTLLFVSHDLGMVKTFCHRALYLEQGQVKAIGDPEAIATQYLQDIRARQRAELEADAPPITCRPALGPSDKAAAFGDGSAEILSAHLGDSEAARGLYEVGRPVELEVEYRLTEPRDSAATADRDTYLAVVIQNTKLLELGGQRFRLPPARAGRVRVRWINRLAPGEYFISLRLERRIGQDVYLPQVVQIAALGLTSTWDERAFLGIMDPEMRLVTDADHCTAGDS
ncbi:ABC transporter ATP-binding protein [Thermochromatium tepidum]|uniref:ATP-binding cassette domain-containing protein n=1 Tax=Thermochromatium tepidum ATCC 43061 TaxID=316276 RepID=A0A6I6E0U6_THETI|nr:ABC transporter ATP-binding protein [Thermochromatium tepidum]QGU33541.1 ATP-binding cassette domain-containing protein [Thermochromatium tepidum ATCC 43061]